MLGPPARLLSIRSLCSIVSLTFSRDFAIANDYILGFLVYCSIRVRPLTDSPSFSSSSQHQENFLDWCPPHAGLTTRSMPLILLSSSSFWSHRQGKFPSSDCSSTPFGSISGQNPFISVSSARQSSLICYCLPPSVLNSRHVPVLQTTLGATFIVAD